MGIKTRLLSAVLGVLGFATVIAPAVADEKHAVIESVPVELADHVPNLRLPEPGLLTGGQPDKEAWKQLAADGVTTVINLRTEAEMKGSTEAADVAAAGMRYLQIPVSGAADVDRAHAQQLWQAIAGASGNVLVHCASGNRVGALLAIGAAEKRDLSPEEAVAFGRAAGLTGLEARVHKVLESAPESSTTD